MKLVVAPALAIVLLIPSTLPVAADDTGFATMHDLRRERGRLCMTDHWHYGTGTGRSKKLAQRDAIGSWASFTAMEYGSDWARWRKATSKGENCTRDSTGYSCSISARACK